MDIERIKIQMRKGVLEYCILIILSKQKSYVSDIINTLKDSKMHVVEGTLYPLLSRLKNQSYLDYEWQESTMGPPRKYYFLTKKGESFLKELDNSWSEIDKSINNLKNIKES